MLLQERYKIIKLIGQGGFGKTFLAVNRGQSPLSYCVVKQLCTTEQTPLALEKARLLFEQEALLLKQLGHHPQIPSLLAHFEEDGQLYLVQEFMDGTNLARVVEEEGTFGEAEIWQLLDELLPVIKFIHERKVIHRDIKPENIIRRSALNTFKKQEEKQRNLVLVDFGAAKLFTEIDFFKTATSIGSAEYVSPEQAKGKPVFASDLYSLGVTCIYLLTGISPFDLFDGASDRWAWQDYVLDKPSDRLTQILDKLLQNALNNRFQSVDEVMQAIGENSHLPAFFNQQNILAPPKDQPAPVIKLQQWQCLHTIGDKSGLFTSVNSVAISKNGAILASGGDDKTIKLWSIETGEAMATLCGHSQAVNSLAFSPDGETIASASSDRTVKLWHLNSNQAILTLQGHTHAVKSVAFTPDGKILASGSWDKTLKLWDITTGEALCTLTSHKLQVSAVAFSPDGRFLASASLDKTAKLWRLGEPLSSGLCPQLYQTLSGHTGAVLAVAFSPDSKTLATGSDDRTIQLWNLESGQQTRQILGHSWSVVAVGFTNDGETLISGSWDKTVKLWKASTGEEICTLNGHFDSVSAIAVSSNGQAIASGSKDKTVKLWQLLT